MAHVTITTNPTREITVIGSGGATQTSIGFEFFEEDGSDIDVYIDGAIQTNPTHYSITPTYGTEGGYVGGTIEWVSTQTSVTVTAVLNMDLARSSDFPTKGSFNITSLNTQLDKLWAVQKQIDDSVNRAPKFAVDVDLSSFTNTRTKPVADTLYAIDSAGTGWTTIATADVTTVAGISADVTTVSGISADVTTVAGISADATTVAGISANVTTVAGVSANVTTVAGISANVTTVAGISGDVTTVAGISADVTTVAGVSANVTTVAGISANVTTVAGISANVTTVAGISADVTTVAGISTDVTAAAVHNWRYTFSDTTTMADPGGGILRLNHATIASVTAIAFPDVTADTGAPDTSDFIATLDDVTNAVATAYITIRKLSTPATFAIYKVTGSVTDNTDWLQVAVTHLDSNGSLTDEDNLVVSFIHSGQDGSGTMNDLIDDTSPQLGGQLDMNNKALGDGTLEILEFGETASAVNHLKVTNAATGNDPTLGIGATGTETNVGINITPKGTGEVKPGLTNFADNEVIRPKLKDYAETTVAKGNLAATPAFDVSAGNVQTGTNSENITSSTMTNWPATGITGSLTLIITNGGAFTFTWPTSVDWAGGSAPSLTAAGVDILVFTSTDAGTTVHGMISSTDSK